jgi:hypothetical protein
VGAEAAMARTGRESAGAYAGCAIWQEARDPKFGVVAYVGSHVSAIQRMVGAARNALTR